mmetsp:Transcript_65074/g.103588  ORF Transcript_65074/g.103588 Transcript_65074/m.103588 type:complete len:443 (+) Transcript_65074:154-1482(+)
MSQSQSGNNSNSNLPSNRNEECVGPSSKNAGKASSCQGCPNQQDCASGKMASAAESTKQTQSAILARLEGVKHILLVLSGKGGVGKSTVASQLAWSLQYFGYNVGVLDIDICGPSIARMMGVEDRQVHKSQSGWTPVVRKDNLCVMSVAFLLSHKNDAIIWRGPRKNGLIKQFLVDVEWNELDFLIIDCPPGTSDEHISIAQLLSARKQDVYTILVTTPQEISLLDVRKEISFANKVGLNVLGVIENMSGFMCPCCNKKSLIFKPTTGGARVLCKQMNIEYLGSIPIDQLLLQCCENGKSFLKYSANAETQNAFTNDANQAQGTRVALLNVIKQITSRIDPQYAVDIEKKESYFKAKRANKTKATHNKDDMQHDEDDDEDGDSDASEQENDGHKQPQYGNKYTANGQMEQKEEENQPMDEEESQHNNKFDEAEKEFIFEGLD